VAGRYSGEGNAEPTMIAQELIAKHFEQVQAAGQSCICAVCGKTTAQSVPTSFLRKTFTNHDLLRFGNDGLCPACTSCLRRDLLFTNFIATENEFIRFKRDGILAHLFNPPEPPFVFCITQSYKKHNAIRAEISWSRESYRVRMEDLAFYFEPEKWRAPLAIITDQVQIFSKTEIRTGDYKHRRIAEYGMDRLMAENEILKPLRSTPQLDLLIYALIKPEEEEECQTSNNSESKQETLF
jgi:hypothetical protein